MLRRTTLALGAATMGVTIILTGCGVESGRSATTSANTECPWEVDESVTGTARIAYQKIPNADLLVKDLGILEACMPKAEIKWANFASGGDVVQAYGANSVDIGLMGSSPATIALSKPLELPISVTWIHDVIGAAESLVVRDKSVQSLADLKGGTVAVPYGSTAHFSLLQAMQDDGLEPGNDIKLINLEPEKMPSAWQGEQIDAAWVWDPVLTELKKTGAVVLSSEDTAKAGKPTYDLGTASNAFIEKNPEFMVQWAKAQDYGVKMIADDPEKAAESMAVELGVEPKAAQALFEGYEYLPAAQQADQDHLGGKIGEDLLATAKFLLAQGSINAVSPPATYAGGVDATPAEEASR